MVRNTSSIYYRKLSNSYNVLDGKEAREVIHQTADGVDRIERS
jgi:hypothetical protein